MPKKLCEKNSSKKKKESDLKYFCKGCGLKSDKENKLCKPKEI